MTVTRKTQVERETIILQQHDDSTASPFSVSNSSFDLIPSIVQVVFIERSIARHDFNRITESKMKYVKHNEINELYM
ncbi:hypothetical protein T07_3472 [Trichinella nelsoni]|uniref:Uncharacterized protein n=1 Tax=Trichinella nelsoni TaxID=6336 RepID=A0A0V0RY73_9BILA|nr:hypothetical protein T07_3472 [Trichinella nelsoni]